MSAQEPLHCWWIRHLPVEASGRYIGHTDIPTTIPDYAPQGLSLPESASWFATPLLRTIDTAHWLMQTYARQGELLKMAPELMEQHFGAWEGKTYDEVWEQAQHQYDWTKPEQLKPPGGESFIGVCARVDDWIDRQLAGEARQLVIVAHAGSIRAALRYALDMKPSQALSFHIDYGGITQITYGAEQGSAEVHYVNR